MICISSYFFYSRKAGREVIEVLISYGAVVERASIDEAYLDLTQLVEAR